MIRENGPTFWLSGHTLLQGPPMHAWHAGAEHVLLCSLSPSLELPIMWYFATYTGSTELYHHIYYGTTSPWSKDSWKLMLWQQNLGIDVLSKSLILMCFLSWESFSFYSPCRTILHQKHIESTENKCLWSLPSGSDSPSTRPRAVTPGGEHSK